MNHKQKFGYMALGASIMALGIIIGQWGTPGIEAQSNGVFDKVVCRALEVVDKDGLVGVRLAADDDGINGVSVIGKQGVAANILSTDEGNMIHVNNSKERGLVLYSGIDQNGETNNIMTVYNPQNNEKGITLQCRESSNVLHLKGQAGEEGIYLLAREDGPPFIGIRDRAGKIKWSAP